MISKLITSVVISSFVVSAAFADDAIRFVPETYPIGYVNQGDVKHIVLKGANVSGKDINLENAFGQGIGMTNFKYPTKIAKNSPVKIEFDIDFSEMEGQINPVIVMVGTDGKPYTAKIALTSAQAAYLGDVSRRGAITNMVVTDKWDNGNDAKKSAYNALATLFENMEFVANKAAQ